MFSVKDVY